MDPVGVEALRLIVGRPLDGVDVGVFGFAFRLAGGGRVLYGMQAAYIVEFTGADSLTDGAVIDTVEELGGLEDPLSFGYAFRAGSTATLILRNGTSGKYPAHLYFIGEEA